jgi:dTDP-4-amino-4,6-dideoxygalactose transaminase
VDRYTWQEVGSSFLPGELTAAFLWAQLEEADRITSERLTIWQRYHEQLELLEAKGILRRPIVPSECGHNAHMYYVLLNPVINRQLILDELKQLGIHAVFHYVPLHSSPAGLRYGRVHSSMGHTDDLSEQLIRLPLWIGLSEDQQKNVVMGLNDAVDKCTRY